MTSQAITHILMTSQAITHIFLSDPSCLVLVARYIVWGVPLSHALSDLVDASQTQYLNFGLEGGRLITLDRKEAEEQGPNILRVHAIASDRYNRKD